MAITYKVFNQPEIFYDSNSTSKDITEVIVGLDRSKPNSADYTINKKNRATHPQDPGFGIRSFPSTLIMAGCIANIFVDNTTQGPTSNDISFQTILNFDYSVRIHIGPKEVFGLGPGTWEFYGNIFKPASTPPVTVNDYIYVMTSRFLDVRAP